MTRILMTGGGTMGPVTPLLAIVEEWKRRDPSVDMRWIGTPKGPERAVVERRGIGFFPLSAPKWDRTRPWTMPWTPVGLAIATARAARLLRIWRPHLIFSAGAYVSVPIVWAARLLHIPVWIHQLDVVPGLANRLMAPAATRVSVTWQESARAFPAKKTIIVGGMARAELAHGSYERAVQTFSLRPGLPTVLVVGGGTGAAAINTTLIAVLDDVRSVANIIHVTGRGKASANPTEGYTPVTFLDEDLADAYAAADLVVVRAGMGTIMELVALCKPTLLVPIPHSHQEANARVLVRSGAAEMISNLTPQIFLQTIRHLLNDPARCADLARAIGNVLPLGAEERMVTEAMGMVSP